MVVEHLPGKNVRKRKRAGQPRRDKGPTGWVCVKFDDGFEDWFKYNGKESNFEDFKNLYESQSDLVKSLLHVGMRQGHIKDPLASLRRGMTPGYKNKKLSERSAQNIEYKVDYAKLGRIQGMSITDVLPKNEDGSSSDAAKNVLTDAIGFTDKAGRFVTFEKG